MRLRCVSYLSMKLLDLFCCCGGISKGFHDAGFECISVKTEDEYEKKDSSKADRRNKKVSDL